MAIALLALLSCASLIGCAPHNVDGRRAVDKPPIPLATKNNPVMESDVAILLERYDASVDQCNANF